MSVGAGAFLTGLVRGMERRRLWNEERRNNEIEDEDRARRMEFEDEDRDWLREQRARQRVEWGYTDNERARAAQERAAAAALEDAEDQAWEEAFGMGMGNFFGGAGSGDPAPRVEEEAGETPPVPQSAPGQPATEVRVPTALAGRGLPQVPENTAPAAGVSAPARATSPTPAAAAQAPASAPDPAATPNPHPPLRPQPQEPSVMAERPTRPQMGLPQPTPAQTGATVAGQTVGPAAGSAPPGASRSAPGQPATPAMPTMPNTGPGRFSRMVGELGLSDRPSVQTAAQVADGYEDALATGANPETGEPLTDRERATYRQFISRAESLVAGMAERRNARDGDATPGANIPVGRDLSLSQGVPNPPLTPTTDPAVGRQLPTPLAPQTANFRTETQPITAMGGIQIGERDVRTIDPPEIALDPTTPAPPPQDPAMALRPAAERPLPEPLEQQPAAPQPGQDTPAARMEGRELANAVGSPAQVAATGTEQEQQAQAAVAQAAGEAAPSVQIAAETTQATGRSLPPANTPAEVEAQGDQIGQQFRSAYSSAGVQHMMEFYVRNQMFDEAQAFREFIMAEDTQQALYHFGRAQHSAAIGDDDGFVANMAAIYNSGRYYDDGYDLVVEQSGLVRGENGQFSGAQLTFRNRQTGESFTQEYNEAQDFYTLGLGLMAPEVRFEHFMGQVEAAQERRAEILAAAREQAGDLAETEWDRFTEIYDTLAGQERPLGSDQPAFTDLPVEEQVERVLTMLRTFDAQVSGGRLQAGAGQVPVATTR